MNKKILLKIGFLLLLIVGTSEKLDAQSEGFVEVFVRLKHLQSTEGMKSYVFPIGTVEPSINYYIHKMEIKDISGDNVGASVNRNWYYPNRPSDEKHNPNEVLISNVRYSNSFGEKFDLSNYKSLTINFTEFGAGDNWGAYSYYLPPFSWHFSLWASTGNQVQNQTISIEGKTSTGGTVPFPYYFTMEAKYNIDAIERDIIIATESGDTENEFCERQRMRITVPYKSNFKNGTFEFQRKYPGGGWVTIANYHKSNVIYDYAKVSGVQYRARLIPSSQSFGVTDYISTSYVATSKVNIVVNPQITNFSYSIKNVCEGANNGKIKIDGISGATNGVNYIVSILGQDGSSVGSYFVNGYSSDYFTENDVFLEVPVGQYSLAVLHSVTKCGLLKENIYMKQSIEPIYSSVVENPKCNGELGIIQFVKSTSGYAPGFKTFRAVSTSTGDTISQLGYSYLSLSVPPDTYMLSVENSDGCIYEIPGTVEITENPALETTITPSLIMEANGVEYHMCRDELADLRLDISGGVPPYRVTRIYSPFNIVTINLLPNQTTISFPSLDARNYVFQVTDNLGCTSPLLNFELKEVPSPNFPELIYQMPTHDCGVLTSNGSVTQVGNVSEGIAPYDLFFSQQQVTTFDSMNLSNSHFLLTIVDSLGCITREFTDTYNDSFLGLNDDGELFDTIVPCNGSLQLSMVARGGSVATGYSFFTDGVECSLDPNCNLNYFDNSGSQSIGIYEIIIDTGKVYHFEVMDDLGCMVSSEKIFYQPQVPEITGISVVPPNCMNGIYETTFFISDPNIIYSNTINYVLDGVAGNVLLKNDGTPWGAPIKPYEFTISVSGDFTHQITITDELGCGVATPYEFTLEPLSPFTLNVNDLQNSYCSYDTAGWIDLSMTGDSPYSIEIFRDGNRVDSIGVASDDYTFTNLLDGNYTIDVTDRKGCNATETNIILTIPDTLKANVSTTSLINCTGNNGEIQVTNVTGGIPPYMYSLNGQTFQTDPILQNALDSNTIEVRDSNNCILSLFLEIPFAGETLFPTITQTITVAECELGTAVIELPAGFTFPIIIQEIEDPNTFLSTDVLPTSDSLATVVYRDTIENLTLGKHYYFIKDGFGCEKIDSVEMTAAIPLSANVVTKTEESCYQQSGDGTITVNVNGGQPPYTVSLLDGTSAITNDSTNFSGLTHGYYDFAITDSRGCSFGLRDSIISGSLPLLTFVVDNYMGCVGTNLTADVTLTGVNGVGPYDFAWEDGNTDNPRSGVSPGQYLVTVTDINGCTNQDGFIVESLDSLEINIKNKTDVVCQADSTGQISVTATGAFSPYLFSIDNGSNFQTDSIFSNLPIGDYKVIVKNTHDCMDTVSTSIIFTNPLNATVSTTNETCATADNGTLEIIVQGGVAPFSYSLDNINFQPQNEFTGLTAGNYTAWVQDGSGCKAVYGNNIITEPLILTLSTSLVANENCNQINGSASGNVSGGTPPYIFEWDGNSSLNNLLLENTSSGLHTLKVTDANLCVTTSSVMIGSNDAPEVSLENSQSEICGMSNGLIDLKIVDGTSPFTFQWSHDASLNDSLAIGLSAGNYSVTVTDVNACSDILDITIDNIFGPTISLENSQPEICGMSNGLIDLKVINGTSPFTFQWSHDISLNDSLAIGLSAGNYSVTVTDINACSDILNISTNEISGPTLSVSSKTNSLCIDNNGKIVLSTENGTSPFSYNWSHDSNLNNNTATNLSGGNYSATVTDGNGCSNIITTSIDFDNPQLLVSSNITHALCDEANGAIQLSVSGGAMQPYTYAWSHDMTLNSNLADNLSEGSYMVTITDALGCSTISNTLNVNNSPAPVLSIASFNNTDCLNPMGDITVQTIGGTTPFTYTWNHDSNITGASATGLNSGNYSITVTDGNGCTDVVSQQLIEFVGSISITNELECSYDTDGSLLVTLQGVPTDYNYLWSDPSFPNSHIASNLSSGVYTVTVTNSNGCTQDFSIDLTAPEEILPNISNVIPVGCGGNLGSATSNPTGGIGAYTYLWSDANGQTTPTASNLPVGNYSVLITDENGCTANENIAIVQSTEIVLTSVSTLNPLCNGDENGSIEISASQGFPPYNYLWNNDETTTTINNLGSSEYIVTVTDAVGCTNFLSVTLDEPIQLEANALLIQEPFCSGGNEGIATVSVMGGTTPYQYQWNDSQNQITDTANLLVANNYNVTITDANGCTRTSDVILSEPTPLDITEIIMKKPSCVDSSDGSIEISIEGGTPDYEYSWNGNPISNNNIFTNIENGNYTVEIIDAQGCTISETFELLDPDSILLVNQNLTLVTCEGTPNGAIEILAEGGDQNISYAWSNGMNESNIENLTQGTYEVSITDGLGCELVDSFEITSIDMETIDLGSRDTFICNNDVLFFDFSNSNYNEFSWGSVREGELSNESSFSTYGEETYYLHALRNDGCLVEDSIQVYYTGVNLDAFFIAPTDIVIGDTIVALELTLPIPDGVSWEYDSDNIELVRQIDNQYLFYFSEVGEYDLKMTASLAGCRNDISKRIFVYADSTEIPFINPTVPIITDLKLFPNPNDGVFTIDVELAATNDMVIDIFNEQSMLVERSIFTGKDFYSKNYQLNLSTGIYYAIVQVAGARRSITFVID